MLRIDCAPNLRDIGGKASRFGGTVRYGRLYRAEAIMPETAADMAALAAMNIRLVCDLRSAQEVSAATGYWPASGAEVLAMDVTADIRAGADPMAAMRADPGEPGAVRLMTDTYRALPAACAGHLAKLFARATAGDHPILIHCTAGKDRTGFVSAMLLHALGVAEADILADYLRSGERQSATTLASTRAIMEAGLGGPVDPAALAAPGGVRTEYLAASLDSIRIRDGGVEAYLADAAGLDDARRRVLVDMLVQ